MTTIQTDRLRLRPFFYEDAPELARHLNNWNVVRWLSAVPFPYTVDMARDFILSHSQGSYCIEFQGRPIGAIGDRTALGYWLAEPHWGQGLIPEAATTLISHWFTSDGAPIPSGYFSQNTRSARVLTRLGFENTTMGREFSASNGQEMDMQYMELTKARWLQVQAAG